MSMFRSMKCYLTRTRLCLNCCKKTTKALRNASKKLTKTGQDFHLTRLNLMSAFANQHLSSHKGFWLIWELILLLTAARIWKRLSCFLPMTVTWPWPVRTHLHRHRARVRTRQIRSIRAAPALERLTSSQRWMPCTRNAANFTHNFISTTLEYSTCVSESTDLPHFSSPKPWSF